MNGIKKIHRPSRLQAYVFFFISLLIAVFIAVWMLFINKGTLLVEGPVPFTIKVASKEKKCEFPPCALILTPHSYGVRFKKEGFFDDVQNVTLQRGKQTKITADFKLIPTIQEKGDIVLPFSTAPLRPPFLGMQKFENFPKNAKNALFSHSAHKALMTLGKELYIYDVKDRAVSEINLSLENTPAWAGDEIVFLERKDSKHFLRLWKNKKGVDIVSFERQFKNPFLLGAPKGDLVLIVDEADDGFAYYFVDIAKKTRKRLNINPKAQVSKWVGDYVIFENKTDEEKEIFAIHGSTFEKISLPAADAENIIELQPLVFVFTSDEKLDAESVRIGPAISEMIEAINTSLFITEYNLSDQTAHTLVTIPVEGKETIHRLTTDLNAKKLYFTKKNRLFEVILSS